MESIDYNEITERIIGCALRVHSALGPGLFESVYEKALAMELQEAGLAFERQVPIPVAYRGVNLGEAFRADLVVEERVLVELKSVEVLLPVHRMQVITYLRLANLRLGLLLNFSSAQLKR